MVFRQGLVLPKLSVIVGDPDIDITATKLNRKAQIYLVETKKNGCLS